MKSFAKHLRARRIEDVDLENTEGLLDVDELDIAPLGVTTETTAPAGPASVPGEIDHATNEAADFAERLGDLDRFIGGPATPGPTPGPASPVTSVTPLSWSGGSPARNLPAAPIPSVAPISHPRPAPAATAPSPSSSDAPAVDPDGEAQEFLDRLSDLDRFIGGSPAAPATVDVGAPGASPETDTDTEAQEFLDRLGDLDRFIGGQNPPTG